MGDLPPHPPGDECQFTRSEAEIVLLTFCETEGIPIPELNVYIEGWLVDALWRKQRVVVEVDGWGGHRTPAQLHANHQRDLELRAKRYVVLRYARRQFVETPAPVAADVLLHLARELRSQPQHGLRVQL